MKFDRRTLIKSGVGIGVGLTLETWLKAEGLHALPGNIGASSVTPGALGDPSIRYFGRWDFSSSSQYVSSWGGAYLKVNFTGTTVKLLVGDTSSFYAKIDGGPWVSFANAGGTIDLTPEPLPAGSHSLSVTQGANYDYTFEFQGLIFDEVAQTSPPQTSEYLIEFVGDSITAGYMDPQEDVSDYAWVCAENLGVEHTQIAYPGENLVSGYSGPGMDAYYFDAQSFNDLSPTPWNFAQYTANAVVINLGTNDAGNGVPDDVFQASYTSFLQNIRTKFPQADLFALETFAGLNSAPTQAAVNARNAAGDSKVHYISTTGWLTPVVDFVDGTHPTENGHIKAANLLQPILAPFVNANPNPPLLANGMYTIINRGSGLVLDVQNQLTANGTPIQQWASNGGANQQWTLQLLSGGLYSIASVQSGKVLDVTGQQTADGVPIELYESNGGPNQQWIIRKAQNGYYTVEALQSGKFMDIAGQSTSAGALLEQLTGDGQTSQQWIFQAL